MPIHFGEIGGWLTRLHWFFLGLMPGMLWVTGIIIWAGKGKKKKKGYAMTGRRAVA